MSNVLITGIGGLTPRSIALTLRRNHPNYRLVGCDIDKRALGFFMPGLLDARYIVPRCDHPDYFKTIERIVREEHIDYAFVQPEAEIVAWGVYYEKWGRYPCSTLMGRLVMSEALRSKSATARILEGTSFIPRTIRVTQEDPRFDEVEREFGFPCWIRATEGTGGLGSLQVLDLPSYRSWLAINNCIPEFTVSEYLPGRHLANQMLYYKGEYIKGAALECVEYVMANTAPSRVTGNTHFGRFLDDPSINEFCDRCMRVLQERLGVNAHGVFSFDLKEDACGELKVTEVNVRHMAYTGVMARAGFDLIEDTVRIMEDGNAERVIRDPFHHYDQPYVFLRDVDVEPILLGSECEMDNVGSINFV